MHLLALSEALTGFGFISLAVSYLVSLTAALSFYHQACQKSPKTDKNSNEPRLCWLPRGTKRLSSSSARNWQPS
jgi:hypothetical protein